MGLFDTIKSIFSRSQTTPSDPSAVRYITVPMRHAGITVDHDTAMRFSAVFRAVAYISQTVAGLPWDVIRETERKTTKLTSHPVSNILRYRPNPEMSSMSWRETMIAWALTWGNGYSEIELDGAGRPVALWPMSPDRVNMKRDRETNEIVYEISSSVNGTTYLPKERVFHLHGLGYDGLTGYSVISLASRSIGLSLAAEFYGEDYFANGLVSTGVIKHPNKLSKEAQERLRASFEENNTKFGKKWRPLVFEEGMEWQSLSIPPEDAQMLETRKFQVNDIARWFGIPPHKLADLERATFSNIEHQSIEVVNDALMPWVNRLEQEANFKLFSGRERGIRTKINVRGLLRGDDASRAAYYKIMREIGVYSTNDIRRLEDMDPVGNEGDALIVQLNQTTLDKLVNGDPMEEQQSQEVVKKEEGSEDETLPDSSQE